jgi:LDH2 family malate/lactate/ureidoglycolate dehydrogenase
VFDFNFNDTDACNTGHFIIALDVVRFTPLDTFKSEMDRHLRDLRTRSHCPVAPCACPGKSAAGRAERLANGVPMPGELVSELDKLASETGITLLRGR